MSDRHRNFWLTPNGLGALGLIGAVLYFLLTEHRAHFIAVLPYLIIGLCPLMHLFMHRGHGGHHGHAAHSGQDGPVSGDRHGRHEERS